MEELSIILESKQSELDQKDELVKKVGEFNDTVDKLKVELSETKEERDRLEERIEELEQETREKYEFESQRSGTPPGESKSGREQTFEKTILRYFGRHAS